MKIEEHGLKSQYQYRYRQWFLIPISSILVVRISNFGHIDNAGLDIGRYHMINIISGTSKADTIFCQYIFK